MSSIYEKIWAGEAPAHVVYRSDEHDVMAILSPDPVIPGHTDVITRRPIDKWQDLRPVQVAKIALTAQVVARRIDVVLCPPRVTWAF